MTNEREANDVHGLMDALHNACKVAVVAQNSLDEERDARIYWQVRFSSEERKAADLMAVAEFVAALCERDGTLANALFSGSGAGAETLQGACLAAIARARGEVTPPSEPQASATADAEGGAL